MTRPGDVAIPALTPHVVPPDAPIARWPVRLRIALERLPQYAYGWDDPDPAVVWDDPAAGYVWDDPAQPAELIDVICDFVTLDIEPGEPDDLYLFPPVEATLTLDNRAGAYTVWTADGRLAYWAPGRRLQVWAHDDAGVDWWLFSGRVASWQANVAGMVTVVAYDGLAQLAAELGGTTTFGVAGDRPLERIQAITATAGYPPTDPVHGDPGDNVLTTSPTDRPPIEAIQVAALSDGGLFYGDADGALVYRDRLWRAGRADQTTIPTMSDNVCTVPVVAWDVEAAADDERLATDVVLVNEAGLTASASTGAGDIWQGDARYRLTHPDADQWTGQAAGDDLAAYLLAQQSTPAAAINALTLYPLDPNQPAIMPTLLDLRRGDRVNFLHDYVAAGGVAATLDVTGVVLGVGHSITPDGWQARLALSRTVEWRLVERWDETRFVWDDPDPLNVWRY